MLCTNWSIQGGNETVILKETFRHSDWWPAFKFCFNLKLRIYWNKEDVGNGIGLQVGFLRALPCAEVLEGMQWELHPPTFWALYLNLLVLSSRLLVWTKWRQRRPRVLPWTQEPAPGPRTVPCRCEGPRYRCAALLRGGRLGCDTFRTSRLDLGSSWY